MSVRTSPYRGMSILSRSRRLEATVQRLMLLHLLENVKYFILTVIEFHSPVVEFNSLSTRWPFHALPFDFISPINPPSLDDIWIQTTTECYTKWVEVNNFEASQ